MNQALTPLPRPLALTMGDPCGIGPEIIAMAFAQGAAANAVVVAEVWT